MSYVNKNVISINHNFEKKNTKKYKFETHSQVYIYIYDMI